MEEFIKEISEKIYNWLLNNGYKIPISNIKFLLVIIFLTPACTILYKLFKKLIKYFKHRIAIKDLHPFIDKSEIKEATKYFIETKAQNISPANEDEPRNSFAFVTKEFLIRFFFKAIADQLNDNRHYLILADSGMGKTTFLINLYIRYVSSFKKRRYKMVLLPLAHPKLDLEIENIKDKQNVVLLLDGFDEDSKAIENYLERLKNLMRKTYKFRKILLTSRSQFFPSEDKEPSETFLYKVSLNNDTQHYFKKIYISPFDDKDVLKYLNKKFPILKFWNYKKRENAKRIIKLAPNLMVRPMLLSYIETLVDKESGKALNKMKRGTNRLFAVDIYRLLIDRWIAREAKRIDINRRDDFAANMFKFSEDLSVYFFTKGELTIPAETVLPFAKENHINLTELELKGKSLLNRDAAGNYKFAHKSILEYFLAERAMVDKSFGQGTLFFQGMPDFDQAEKFCTELMIQKNEY